MSVIERALQRIQKQSGVPQTTRKQPVVARVAPQSKTIVRNGAAHEELVAEGRMIEFSTSALSEAGLCALENSRLADEYRLIKQPILRKAAEEVPENPRGNLVMVASSLGGEGKTFTSVNLSLSLASEKDWQVLLVDVDCRNPQLSRLLGVEKEPGLMDLLKDPSVSLESVVLPTNISGLSVLPLGSRDGHAAEYLRSSQMDELCERLASMRQGQIVIFDSSPLLLTSESSILSRSVGQIALVVLADATPRHAVHEAIEKLDSDKAIGLVLNRADESGDLLTYGSYHAYGDAGV
ncbi:MAG: CpsD/CapB family tyrosine-protein kinase [Gammaproteobacteria bacterium]|jgi:exopolysaccharide/PEP-CTERM locus tyrosine autokinase